MGKTRDLFIAGCLMIGLLWSCTGTPKPAADGTASAGAASEIAAGTMAESTPSVQAVQPSETASPAPVLTASPTAVLTGWRVAENWKGANQIRALLVDQSGGLWAGGPDGLTHWDLHNGEAVTYISSQKPYGAGSKVVDLALTMDGNLWVATWGDGLSRFDGNNWENFTKENGLPSDYISSLTVTPAGTLWVDTFDHNHDHEGSLWGQFDGIEWVSAPYGGFYQIEAAPNNIVWVVTQSLDLRYPHNQLLNFDGEGTILNGEVISVIAIAPDGVLWAAADSRIFQYYGNTWHTINPPWIGKTTSRVTAIAVSENGEAWFGFSFNTLDDVYRCGWMRSDDEFGVYRYDGQNWTHFTTADGLVDNKICAITIGPDGNVWFGSFDQGVSRFDGTAWTSYIIR